MPESAEPRVLCDTSSILGACDPGTREVLWRLADTDRQLDANLVRLPPGDDIPAHTEPDLDVLLLVLDGTGSLACDRAVMTLGQGLLCWLPRGCTRSIQAGGSGLAYLTTHTRRPGLQIGNTRSPAASHRETPG